MQKLILETIKCQLKHWRHKARHLINKTLDLITDLTHPIKKMPGPEQNVEPARASARNTRVGKLTQ